MTVHFAKGLYICDIELDTYQEGCYIPLMMRDVGLWNTLSKRWGFPQPIIQAAITEHQVKHKINPIQFPDP